MHSHHVRQAILVVTFVLGCVTLLDGNDSMAVGPRTPNELSARPVNVWQDSVVIESRSFPPGHPDCSVGVFISNLIPLNILVLPFEFRAITPGSFIAANLDIGFPEQSRLRNSSLGDVLSPDECPNARRLLRMHPTESELSCGNYDQSGFGSAAAQVDFVSPDAMMYTTACISPAFLEDSTVLKPGVDTIPSLNLLFGVSSVLGSFVIDSACIRPANRLLFAEPSGYNLKPYFRPGIITIECGPCRCHADPWCDGVTSIVDVILTIDRAFRGDALPCAPYVVGGDGALDGPTDFDCSGATNVVDVVKAINVCFDAADPATEFCSPCL